MERTRSFRLKTDAARFAAAVETDISRGDWVNPELARETFSYWADQWLAATYHLKPKTQEGYRSVLNHHLLPRLANTPVARIDLPMVTSLLSEFSRNGAGAGTVGNIRGALGLVLEQARRSGAIRTNPVADTKPPKKPQQEMIFLTPMEVVAVAEEVTYLAAPRKAARGPGALQAPWSEFPLRGPPLELEAIGTSPESYAALMNEPAEIYPPGSGSGVRIERPPAPEAPGGRAVKKGTDPAPGQMSFFDSERPR